MSSEATIKQVNLSMRAMTGGVPLSQAVLDRGKLGQLPLPVQVEAESLDISVLVKVAIIAPFQLGCHAISGLVASLFPEGGISSGLVVLIAKLKV